MKKSFVALAILLISESAFAGSLSLKPEVIYSTGQLKVDGVEFTGPSGETATVDMSNSRFVKGYGGAMNLELELTQGLRAGAGAGYLSYNQDHGRNRPNFNDRFGKVQLSYDLLSSDSFTAYTVGGVSYHDLGLNSEKSESVKSSTDDFHVWNYDAGIGTRYQASEKVSLGLEYRVSNSFAADNSKLKMTAIDSGSVSNLEVKNVKLSTNEVITSFSYTL